MIQNTLILASSQNTEPTEILNLGKDKAYQGKEDDLQIAFFRWFSYSRYKELNFFHVANERKTTVKVNNKTGRRYSPGGNKLKQKGVVAGVSDNLILEPSRGYHGLAIELKVKGGKVQPTQTKFLNKCKRSNYKAVICWNLESAINVVSWYFGQTEKLCTNQKEKKTFK